MSPATFVSYEQRAAEMNGGEVLYGLDKELAEKAAAKYDVNVEAATRAWIEAVTHERLGEMPLQQELKSGVVLCQLVNAIKPGVCPKPSPAKMPFKQMENISNYLKACDDLGVPRHEQFQTISLYENKNMLEVLTNLQALGRAAQRIPGYSGPVFGVKLASGYAREFTEEQRRAAAAESTFLGKGSHGQATAGGQFDTSKEIVKCKLPASTAPTMVGMGSHAGASQADVPRNIRPPPGSLPSPPPAPAAPPAPPKPAAAPLSSNVVHAMSTCSVGSKQYGHAGGNATFVSYEQRAAEMNGGEVLYGLDKELAEKAAAKYDVNVEAATRAWIEAVTHERLGEMPLQQELKSGVVLCQLVNAIKPGVCPKPSPAKMPFKQMENISNYLKACDDLGVPRHEQFQTISLYENKNMLEVLTNLQALGRAAQRIPGYSGPAFGVKLASGYAREFTEEQRRAAAAESTFLGKGSHGQATAGGQFDTSKEIVKCKLPASTAPTMVGMGSHAAYHR